jgi:hypothetical protein
MTEYPLNHRHEERIRRLEEQVATLLGIEPPKIVEPVKSEPMPRWDPTANLGMPASVMREMAKVDCGNPMDDVRAMNAGRGMVKQGSKSDPSQRAVGERGWIEPAPLRHHGPSYADRIVDDGIGGKGK